MICHPVSQPENLDLSAVGIWIDPIGLIFLPFSNEIVHKI